VREKVRIHSNTDHGKYNVANHKKINRVKQFLSGYTFHLPYFVPDDKKSFVLLDNFCGAVVRATILSGKS